MKQDIVAVAVAMIRDEVQVVPQRDNTDIAARRCDVRELRSDVGRGVAREGSKQFATRRRIGVYHERAKSRKQARYVQADGLFIGVIDLRVYIKRVLDRSACSCIGCYPYLAKPRLLEEEPALPRRH